VTDPLESLFPGGPNARSNGNVAAAQINLQTLKWEAADFAAAGDDKLPAGKPAEEWKYGDVDEGFKAAKLVIDESFVAGGFPHHSMETRSAFAYWEGSKCFLHGSNQSHTSAVPNISRLIGIPPEDLVFIAEYCGGGFGSKIPGYPNMAIAALMSKKIGRPVMHRISRNEEYAIGSQRPSFQGRLKLGFAADGRITAADLYIVQETGAQLGAGDFRNAGSCCSILYQPVAMRYRGVPVLTNTPPTGPQRGPGENQFVPAIEPMMDKAARELKIDRLAIRKINAPDSTSKMGADRGPITSAFIREALDQAATKFNWDQKKSRSGQRNGTKVTGIGIGQGYHSAGSNGFDGLLRITPDGKLHIHTGVGNLGTYSHSATARVAAEILNYNWDNAIIERGDSRRGLPWNSNQAGSLTASTQSRTMYVAAMDMKQKLLDIAAQMLGGAAADYDLGDEKVVRKGDASKSITFAQAAQKAMELGGKYAGKEVPNDINPVTKHGVEMIAGTGLIAVAKDNLPRVGITPGLTVSFAEIELDTETGKVEIKEMLCVADCGTVLHPQGLGHQIKGGNVMGIGLAHLERHVYDPKLGVAMIAGTGLIAVAKDNLPRVGITPGLTVSFAEVELDTETGKVNIKEMLCVADCGTVLHPLGLGHQIKGGNVMGIGLAHLERHVYDPKLGIPTTQSIEQSKPPTYLDVPAEIGWGAVDKPDPQNPVGVKGVGEPVQGSGAAAITSAIADALGGHLFNRTPVSLDMILNHLNKRPQAHKPLQINTV